MIFLLDFGAERYVEMRYGVHSEQDIQSAITGPSEDSTGKQADSDAQVAYEKGFHEYDPGADSAAREQSFRQQRAAFLILEFGVIFHSVIIRLNLGVAGSELATLYVVLVFHQSFEGWESALACPSFRLSRGVGYRGFCALHMVSPPQSRLLLVSDCVRPTSSDQPHT
ncbi:MAG: hypothetical protein M1830_000652 [Pleopsidium flavum]|nr:MAG: hypothetical protein M1830_000652 [Pleopsidium flavum]